MVNLGFGLILVVSCAVFLQVANGAGMTTHSMVGQRALHWFEPPSHLPEYKELLEARKQWWQPGTFFPDWGYSCGYGAEAEAAHWPPFQNYTANYIRETYPRPWTEDAQNFVAFLFGMMVHSVSDSSWHSLSMDEGLIEAMQFTEFLGSFDDAHNMADIGGEFVLKYTVDLTGNAELRWFIPTTDLHTIYHQYFPVTAVTEQAMERCLLLGFAGIWANQLLGDLALPFARNSPLLNEEYENYFLGGLDDMAAWTTSCWGDLIQWLEVGGNIRPMCTMMENQWNREKQEPLHHPTPSQQTPDAEVSFLSDLTGEGALETLEKLGYSVRATREGRHTSLELLRPDGADPLAHHASELRLARSKAVHESSDPSAGAAAEACIKETEFRNSSTLRLNTATPYSQFGSSVVTGDFNGDGIDDLAIGAPAAGGPGEPQIGAVYIVYGKRGLKPPASVTQGVEQFASLVLRGEQAYSRFGFSLAVVDLNRDGIDDLAIAAPTYNGLEMYYDGRVYVHFGHAVTGLATSAADVTITTQQPFPIVNPDTNHQFKFVLMGHVLSSGDIDNDGFADLIIGSPLAAPHALGHQRGLVSVFLASFFPRAGELDVYADADIELFGVEDYQRFGSDVQLAVLPTGQRILLVGSNFYATPSTPQAVGRLYGYDVGVQGAPLLFVITGNDELQKFGTPLLVGDFYGDNRTLVAVGSISEGVGRAWQAGALRVFDPSNLRGEILFRNVDFLTTIQGGERNGHFGWGLTVSPTSLWISEPLYGNYRADEEAGTGRIVEYPLGPSSFPRGIIRDRVGAAATCLSGAEPRARFGQHVVSLDLDGDGLQDLLVTSHHSSSGSPHSGVVSVFFS